MMNSAQRKKLDALFGQQIQWDCPLKKHTSLIIGGPATAFIEIDTKAQLQQLLIFCYDEGVDWRVIGGGTNLLVKDKGYDGIILHLGSGFKDVSSRMSEKDDRVIVSAGAGLGLTRLSSWCAGQGFAGLEFASGIPGSLGGAVIMNAGAWGTEISNRLDGVELVGRDGSMMIDRDQLHFGYRCWSNQEKLGFQKIVVEVHFLLQPATPEEIQERCQRVRQKRKQSQPPGGATCGSVFKNPSGDSAGRLIDACGLKGKKVGGLIVSTQHANFFVNTGTASAADMNKLMEIVQVKVEQECGVKLEPEVHFI